MNKLKHQALLMMLLLCLGLDVANLLPLVATIKPTRQRSLTRKWKHGASGDNGPRLHETIQSLRIRLFLQVQLLVHLQLVGPPWNLTLRLRP